MDVNVSSRVISCRLCGINLRSRKYRYIFEEATNLSQIIAEALPINVSLDDNVSKYVCLICYEKVIRHYKFIQDVLEHERKLDKVVKAAPLYDIPNSQKAEIIDNFSRSHGDTIYTCPNCNVNLMILLSSNRQGCDYSFQISLAVVSHGEKLESTWEKVVQTTKNMRSLVKVQKSSENTKEKFNIEGSPVREDLESLTETVNETLHIIQEMTENNYCERSKSIICSTSSNTPSKWRSTKPQRCNGFCKVFTDSMRVPQRKLFNYKIISGLSNYNCDSESANENVVWLGSDIQYKLKRESSRNVIKGYAKFEKNNMINRWPKFTCELCGVRYLSQLKYEFHMERHKTDKMHKYICTLCNKEAGSEKLLWNHYSHIHKSSIRYACAECGEIFTNSTKLSGHQKRYDHISAREICFDDHKKDMCTNTSSITHCLSVTGKHGKISVNCNLCGKIISDLDSDAINDLVTCASCEDPTLSLMVDGNEAKVISPRQYHCSKCPKHFVRKERLEFHEMRHNENMKEFICSTCGKEFSAENSLYEHYLFVHKGARPHICELCGKSFQLKARLKEHHRTHTGERPYRCDVCGQRCMTTNALKLHRKTHFSQNRYMCDVCNKSFSKKQNMNEHLEKHWKCDRNVPLPRLFKCSLCLEEFPTYRMLKYHMTGTHKISNQDPILTEQKPWYECDDCHEKFKHQMSLKAHRERVHEGKVNPTYECDECGATYRIKQLLINHIKSKHDGEKRYKCAQCEKGFNDTKSLYNHILLHTGKKPFACEYCNISFRRKDSRDHHRRKHTGEQPYQCPDCGESFSTYNTRSKHRKREHGEGELECPECGDRCRGQQGIRIHLNKHLGEKLKILRSEYLGN